MLLLGKSTISMAIFNSFLYVYQRVIIISSKSSRGLDPSWSLCRVIKRPPLGFMIPSLRAARKLDPIPRSTMEICDFGKLLDKIPNRDKASMRSQKPLNLSSLETTPADIRSMGVAHQCSDHHQNVELGPQKLLPGTLEY